MVAVSPSDPGLLLFGDGVGFPFPIAASGRDCVIFDAAPTNSNELPLHNDQSTLEHHHHAASAFQIIERPNILASLSLRTWRVPRHKGATHAGQVLLATNMSGPKTCFIRSLMGEDDG